MKLGTSFWSAVRMSWPLVGGAWGAWLGFGGYLGLSPNHDSFAMVFALGFYLLFALVGLSVGVGVGWFTGRSVENLFRRCGVGRAVAVSVATVVNVLFLCLIAGAVQAKFPGLRFERRASLAQRVGFSSPERPIPKSENLPTKDPCERPPPENPKERELWESECR